MSSPPPPPPSPPSGPTPLRLLTVAVVAIGGVVGLQNLTDALGYGGDFHALRGAVAGAALGVGGFVAIGPRRSPGVRLAAVLLGLGAAAAAWVYVPCRPGELSLADAVAKRDDLKARMQTPLLDNLAAGDAVFAEVKALIPQYPYLTEPVVEELKPWTAAAAETVVAKYRAAAPDDPIALAAAKEKARDLTDAFAGTRDTTAPAEQDAARRVDAFWATELRKLAPGDTVGYREWVIRSAPVVALFPDARADLAAATTAWADRTAGDAIAEAQRLRRDFPKVAREQLAEGRRQFANAAAIGPNGEWFTPARRKVFSAALDAAKADALVHLEAGRAAAAYGVARAHAVDWFEEGERLGPEAAAELTAFRDGYGYLDALAAKAGDAPETAPPPRPKP